MNTVFITKEVIDYVNDKEWAFNGVVLNLNDEWEIERVITYLSVNDGNPVIEIKKGKEWMRLPCNLFFSENYAKYLSDKAN